MTESKKLRALLKKIMDMDREAGTDSAEFHGGFPRFEVERLLKEPPR